MRMLPLLALTGCFATPGWFATHIQDVDGDGVDAIRFGGRDCDDDDPTVGDCDRDEDGVQAAPFGDDCDDDDASVFPGAAEQCDGIDNDCDALIDNADPDATSSQGFFPDGDGDSFGDATATALACPQSLDGVPLVADASDCDDLDPSVNPNATEQCGDAVDNDCDGGTDDIGQWFDDVDGDGFGLGTSLETGPCTDPGTGYASIGGDCDDTAATTYPGAPEIHYDGIDQNCGGLCDDFDDDGDLYVESAHWADVLALGLDASCGLVQGDCDDADADRYDGNTEVCDGIDNDCNNLVDTEDLDSTGPAYNILRGQVVDRYADLDGDTYHGTLVQICPAEDDPDLYTELPEDCFDSGPTPSIHLGLEPEEVNPGAAEVCDGADNDCDDRADWDNAPFVGSTVFYLDDDGDGFGDAQYQACNTDAFAGLVPVAGDCDDARPDVYPGAEEICGDLVRQDCDNELILVNGSLVPTSPWDCDADGFEGVYNNNGSGEDCEDELPDVNPGVTHEICDGVDNDCDGLLDSDDDIDQPDFPVWYLDVDGDGFASAEAPSLASCGQPAADYVLALGDCDETDATRNPDTAWYRDADGDGYGRLGAPDRSCLQPGPDHILVSGDCDDTDDRYNPETRWLEDLDGDFFGAAPSPLDPETLQCLPPSSGDWVPAFFGTDCDDTDADVVAQGTWYRDADGDGVGVTTEISPSCSRPPGYAAVDGDCDDDPITGLDRTPGQLETCDGIDNDCDELIDDADPSLSTSVGTIGFQDQDGDGFGSTVSKLFCIAPSAGWTATTGDCDDADPGAFPGNAEVCSNGADDDCDGTVDQEPTWYADEDDDGFGSGEPVVTQCLAPDGGTYSTRDDDCDDTDDLRFPGAEERDVCDAIDDNCDGTPEPRLTWYPDLDQDGFGDDDGALVTCTSPAGDWVLQGGDCDDTDGTITFGQIWYLDADGDTLGNPASTQFACAPDDLGDAEVWLRGDVNGNGLFDPGDEQLSVLAGDCDDTDATVADAQFFYPDADADTWGEEPGQAQCPIAGGAAPDGFASRPGDCDDTDETISPEQLIDVEGDQVDANCDGADGIQGGILWYPDADGDGLGDANALGTPSYTPGWRTANTDCDDNDPNVGSGLFVFPDADSDGFGGGFSSFASGCTVPVGSVLLGGDCDDDDAGRFPGASEQCNGLDDDCDGAVPVLELDLDQDSYRACTVGANRDCDDLDPLAYPFNVDPPSCDGAEDSDCDPATPDDDFDDLDGDGFVACDDPDDTDENNVPGAQLWYRDADGDQYGVDDPATNVYALTRPAGFSGSSGDCDDTTAQAFPGFAIEFCDGIDNDCNGVYVLNSAGEPNYDVTSPAGPQNFSDPDLQMAADLDGNGVASLNSSFGGCGDIPGPTGTVFVGGEALAYELLPSAGGPAAVSDCDDGTNDQGVAYWGDLDGDGLGHPAEGFGLACPGEMIPPGSIEIPADFRMDCRIDDSTRTYLVQPGEYGDADGDGGYALTSKVDFCVGSITNDPLVNPDCDDSDAFLPLTEAASRFDVSTQAELDQILAICEGYVDVVVGGSLSIGGTFKGNTGYHFRPGNDAGACSFLPGAPDVGGCLSLSGPVTSEAGAYVQIDGIPLEGRLEIEGAGAWSIENTVAHEFSLQASNASVSLSNTSVVTDGAFDPSLELIDSQLQLSGTTLGKTGDDGVTTLAYLERSFASFDGSTTLITYQDGFDLVESNVNLLGTLLHGGSADGFAGFRLQDSSVYGQGVAGSTGVVDGFETGFVVDGSNNAISSMTIQGAQIGMIVDEQATANVDQLALTMMVGSAPPVFYVYDQASLYATGVSASGQVQLIDNYGAATVADVTASELEAGRNRAGASLTLDGADITTWNGELINDGSVGLEGIIAIDQVNSSMVTGTGTLTGYGTMDIAQALTGGDALFTQTSISLNQVTIGQLDAALARTGGGTLDLSAIEITEASGLSLVDVTGGYASLFDVSAGGPGGSIALVSMFEASLSNVEVESNSAVLIAVEVDSLIVENSQFRGSGQPAALVYFTGGSFTDSTVIGEEHVLDVSESTLVLQDSTLWSEGAGVLRTVDSDVTALRSLAHGNGGVFMEQGGGSLDLQYTLLHDADPGAAPTIDCLSGTGTLDLNRVWTEDSSALYAAGCNASETELVDGRSTLQPTFVETTLQGPLAACLGPSSLDFLWPCF